MIGSILIGGLGNQMFQYAAGRALALRHNTSLALDLSSFAKRGDAAVARHYELDRLAVDAQPQRAARDFSFLLARRRHHALQRLSGWVTIREATLSYDRAFERAPNDTYLLGYWQSWRYLVGYEDQIAAELQPRDELSPRNVTVQNAMRDRPSLSLHVRRGDYLHAVHEVHGSLDMGFYTEAIRRVRDVQPDITIYIFSDDLAWCRQAFATPDRDVVFVDWNRGEDSWQDLFLMSACRHAIVANSSFSWWGAWLGDRHPRTPARTVIAPRRWFAGLDVAIDDRCPPAWQVL